VGEDGSEPADAPPAGVVATCSDDGLAKLIDPRTKSVLAIFRNESVAATCVTYLHPDLYVAGTDGRIRGFNLATAAPTRTLTGHTDAINAVMPIRGELFSAADDCRLLMWDLAQWAPKHEFRGHTQSVAAMNADGAGELITAGFDGTLRVWDREGVVERFRQAAQLAAEEAAERVRKEKEAAKEAAAKAAAKKAKGKGKK
jgi:WD40 repeat protein